MDLQLSILKESRCRAVGNGDSSGRLVIVSDMSCSEVGQELLKSLVLSLPHFDHLGGFEHHLVHAVLANHLLHAVRALALLFRFFASLAFSKTGGSAVGSTDFLEHDQCAVCIPLLEPFVVSIVNK